MAAVGATGVSAGFAGILSMMSLAASPKLGTITIDAGDLGKDACGSYRNRNKILFDDLRKRKCLVP
jgi:hypothetical protein